MTSPTTEVFIFESTTAFQDDPCKVLTSAAKRVLAEDGAQSPIFYGKHVENPGKGVIFLNWDSLEAHQKVIKSPSYRFIGEALAPSLLPGGESVLFHVVFQGATAGALEKPVTGVLVVTLKAPEHRAAVVEILNKLLDVGDQTIAFGQALEDENKYILIGGWSSVEAHLADAAAKPELTAAFNKLFSDLVNKERFFHVNFSKST